MGKRLWCSVAGADKQRKNGSGHRKNGKKLLGFTFNKNEKK
jgi:hypothetical protein